MAKPDWQSQNYKKVNPVQKAAAGTLALGGMLAYGAKKAYDAFKNRKKNSDTSATTGIDISEDIKARNKPMPSSAVKNETPKRQEVSFVGMDEPQAEQVKYVSRAKTDKPNPRSKGIKLEPKKNIKANDSSKTDTDKMSFGKAFNYYLKEKGEGKTFSWRGKSYKLDVAKKDQKGSTSSSSDNKPSSSSYNPRMTRKIKEKKVESNNKKPEMDAAAKKELARINKEIAKVQLIARTPKGQKRFKELREQKKQLLAKFK